jgi:hypothetical protein
MTSKMTGSDSPRVMRSPKILRLFSKEKKTVESTNGARSPMLSRSISLDKTIGSKSPAAKIFRALKIGHERPKSEMYLKTPMDHTVSDDSIDSHSGHSSPSIVRAGGFISPILVRSQSARKSKPSAIPINLPREPMKQPMSSPVLIRSLSGSFSPVLVRANHGSNSPMLIRARTDHFSPVLMVKAPWRIKREDSDKSMVGCMLVFEEFHRQMA